MKKQVKKSITSNVETCVTYEGTKLSTQYPVKDRTKSALRHHIVYFSRCPNVTCNETNEKEILVRSKSVILVVKSVSSTTKLEILN